MAINVPTRIGELKREGNVPSDAHYRTLRSDLTYEQANEYERAERKKCGSHCEGQTGGRRVPSARWSVYRIDW